jgi:hypothetical protein
MTWEEKVSGSDKNDQIFFSIYSYDGVAVVKQEPAVVDNDGHLKKSMNQSNPAVAADEGDYFMLAWVEEKDNIRGLIGRYTGNTYVPIRDQFVINQYGDGDRGQPSVASIGAASGWVVVWQDQLDDGDGDLFMRIYPQDGNEAEASDEIRVDNAYSGGARYPRVAVDANAGRIYICWTDTRNDSEENIIAAVFDLEGNRLLHDFRVDTDPGTERQQAPDPAFDTQGRVVNVFEDRGGDGDVYLNRLRFP